MYINTYIIPVCTCTCILTHAYIHVSLSISTQVLLGLSDHDIVNLSGEPTWYTVCPEDPNLPKLSRPMTVHNKQKGVASVEHLLQRFKHNLSTLKQHTFKSSSSIPNLSFSQTTNNLAPVMRRNMSLLKKEQRRTKKSLSGSYSPQAMFNMLETEIENACGSNPSLEEVKEQLSSILKVLREAQNTEKEIEDGAEAAKKTKLSNILKVLQDTDDTQHTDSNLRVLSTINGGTQDAGLAHVSNDRSFSTLDYRVRKRNHLTSKQNTRPRSDSFRVIPDLRDSLGAGEGKRDKVTVYSFLEEIENSFSQQENQSHSEIQSDTHMTTTVEERKDFTSSLSIPMESQAHYKIVDSFQSEDELDSPSKGGHGSNTSRIGSNFAKSLDHGIYPAEVSLHRINIVDVDKKIESEQKSQRSKTLPNTRKTTTPMELPLALNLNNIQRREPPKQKRRSRSVGDAEDLDGEEELLLVRFPLTTVQEGSIDYLNAIGPLPGAPTTIVDLEDDEVDGEVFSSLDFSTRPTTNCRTSYVKVEEECVCTASSLDFAESSRVISDEAHTGDDTSSSLDIVECPQSSLAEHGNSYLHPDGHERTEMVHLNVSRQNSLVPVNKPEKPEKKGGISKWRSLDNLLGNKPTKKTK